MNKNEIEAKDKRLVKKIRTIVEQKENRVSRRQPFWKKPVFWVPVVCAVLVVSGLTAFRTAPPTAVPTAPEPAPAQVATDTGPADLDMDRQAAEPAAQADAQADAQTDVTMAEQTSPADAQADVAMAEQAVTAVPAPREEKAPEVGGKLEILPAESDTAQAEAPAPAIDSDVAVEKPAEGNEAQPAATEKPTPSPGVEISHLVVCGGVRDKQFISPKSVFSVSADPHAVVWMRVLSADPPFTLTHVYWLNGKRYVDVPLEIRYPHMRTWSRVTLDRQRQIGQWRVDVVNETGQTLDQIEFTVGP